MKGIAYNVIWADDECDTLRADDMIRQYFDKMNIEVIEYVRTSEELRTALHRYYDRVDAVIVDGNFARKDELSDFGEGNIDITGLVHTLSFIDSFNQRRDIPFFLYTGKKTKIHEVCKDLGMLSYFNDTKRIFQKGEVRQLAEAITEAVDHIHSLNNDVTKRYSAILEMASHIEPDHMAKNIHSAELLRRFLLDELSDIRCDRAESMFANLRMILERIAENCKNRIVPEAIDKVKNKYTLNYFARYWSYKQYETSLDYIPYDDDIMPPVLASLVKPFVDILQDGSHGNSEVPLQVTDYVSSTQSPFIFRSALHFVLSMIQWYNSIMKSDRKLYYKRNPYMLIHKEKTKDEGTFVFKYRHYWFDSECMPSEEDEGRDIKIIKTNKKTILEYEFI